MRDLVLAGGAQGGFLLGPAFDTPEARRLLDQREARYHSFAREEELLEAVADLLLL